MRSKAHILDRDFYERPTLEVARELLGQRLVRVLEGQRLSGLIVEVEAYIGEEDKASHAAVGRTPRNEVMYGPAGHAYVYLIYGVHHCLNAVTEAEGFPAAVLIRAIEPREGIEVMRAHRPGRPDDQLTNGPAKLCQALAIDLSLNGADLCTGEVLFIEVANARRGLGTSDSLGGCPASVREEGEHVADDVVIATPRIGVRGDELAKSRPWRFCMQGNRYVSQ
ncbi:MAG: DNA-3-methyladenine glycosylase [Anaerolineae bacterium]